ncbi:MAG: hypothetical protein RMY29_032360 [Nostoc sp. CreGUA01]
MSKWAWSIGHWALGVWGSRVVGWWGGRVKFSPHLPISPSPISPSPHLPTPHSPLPSPPLRHSVKDFLIMWRIHRRYYLG